MDRQFEINRFGGTVLVMQNDAVILKKAYGYADMEWEVKNTVDTKFVLASITKYFTAIATMQLVESNKLALDDKLSKFWPSYPKGDKVTIHMLLTHTAGLALDFDDLYMNSTNITKDSAIAVFQKNPYLFEPGTNCKYSNIGYFLLSQIIEKASGETYESFLKKNIFDKAFMTNSGVSNNDSIISKKAKIYYRNGEGYAHNPFINWNLNTGLDGIYSTIDDLYKLHKAMLGETLLSNVSKTKMTTQYNKIYPDNGFFDSYGYGIFINPYYNHGHDLLTHSGGFIGTRTTYDSYPKDNIFIAVLSNNESESHMISYGLAGILFGADVELPYQHKVIDVDDQSLKKFAGKYENLTIIYDNKMLYANNLQTPLLPESKTKFFNKRNPDRTFEFLVDGRGKVQTLLLRKGGVAETKKRL
ncbi:MAG TPA: serine hydrolase [Flavobacterium sp.]|nr:serine hydrolase [Flavobacterium sp.]